MGYIGLKSNFTIFRQFHDFPTLLLSPNRCRKIVKPLYKVLNNDTYFNCLQLAKERQEEIDKMKEKEASVKEKGKDTVKERKVYSSGVGKFINPNLKKEAR